MRVEKGARAWRSRLRDEAVTADSTARTWTWTPDGVAGLGHRTDVVDGARATSQAELGVGVGVEALGAADGSGATWLGLGSARPVPGLSMAGRPWRGEASALLDGAAGRKGRGDGGGGAKGEQKAAMATLVFYRAP